MHFSAAAKNSVKFRVIKNQEKHFWLFNGKWTVKILNGRFNIC